jgi:hypothetical protein
MGAISRLCHFAQRYDSDGLPPLGYASGEDHGIGRTRTRVTHQEACDVLVIYLAPLPRGFLFGLGTLVRFRCRFRNLRFVHIDGVARQGSDTQQRLRTSRSDLCRACPSQARREFAPTPSLILPILAAHHGLSSADFITNIAESSFRHTHPIDSSSDTHQI